MVNSGEFSMVNYGEFKGIETYKTRFSIQKMRVDRIKMDQTQWCQMTEHIKKGYGEYPMVFQNPFCRNHGFTAEMFQLMPPENYMAILWRPTCSQKLP